MANGIEGAGAGAGQPLAQHRPRRRVSERIAAASPETLLLVAASAASAVLLLALGSRLTFLLDDWSFLIYRRGFSVDTILAPHNENIAIAPLLVYKGLQETLGMDSALPYRVVSTAVFLTSVALLFVWLRRRVGEWAALIAAVLLLFFGSAWEDLFWPFQLGYFGSMAAGLGMLLALDKEDRRGDVIACVLLAVSLSFSSLGLPFLAGAVAAVLVGPRATWRPRAFVALVPAVLFALWWIGWGREAENSITWENVVSAPAFMFEGLAASLSSLFGLTTPRHVMGVTALDWGRPLVVVMAAAVAWQLWRLRRVPAGLIVVAVILTVFWLLTGFNERSGRTPDASRYMYVGAIFVLLVGAELVRGWRPGRAALAVLGALAALSLVSNLDYLVASYRSYRTTSQIELADLAAVEIARDRVAPAFVLDEDIAKTAYVHIEAGPYFSAADAYGTPAYDQAELTAAPEIARQAADLVLANALPVGFDVGVHEPPFGGPAPTIADAAGPSLAERSCLVVAPPTEGGSRLIELPPGGAVIKAPPEAAAGVQLRRFATADSAVVAGEVPAGKTAVLDIPADRSTRPWVLELQAGDLTSVCGRSR